MAQPSVLFLLGTRPEAVKLAPVIREAQKFFSCTVWITAQHRRLLDEVLHYFQIIPDRDFNIMRHQQDLFYLSSEILRKIGPALQEEKPDCVVVQGDTSSAYFGALCAFYCKIPIAHIEAGLRTGNFFHPFPEEMNRVALDHIADFLFAPTPRAVDNLRNEGIPAEKIFLVGNTVVDALYSVLSRRKPILSFADKGSPTCLFTLHRRENLGAPQERIFSAILDILNDYPSSFFYISTHPNPPASLPMKRAFEGHPRCRLIPSLPYPEFVQLLNFCDIILTDSGGIQEEAPYLHKPYLVLREYTERLEGIEQGLGYLVGSDPKKIREAFARVYQGKYHTLDGQYPYGRGDASHKIVEILRRHL
ncbi:MAG: non-hydrolyzing UDP-N-acetylglucosamine 2-epimerase [bacterium JZ-2024 1]